MMNGGRSAATGRGRDGTDACRVGRADGRKFCLRFNDSASIRARSLSSDALSRAPFIRSPPSRRPLPPSRRSAHPPGTPHASNCPHACMHARTHARLHARTTALDRPCLPQFARRTAREHTGPQRANSKKSSCLWARIYTGNSTRPNGERSPRAGGAADTKIDKIYKRKSLLRGNDGNFISRFPAHHRLCMSTRNYYMEVFRRRWASHIRTLYSCVMTTNWKKKTGWRK